MEAFFCQCKYLLKAAEAGTKKTVLGKFGTSLSLPLSALPEAPREEEERANSAFMDMDDAGLSVRGAICGRTHHPHPGKWRGRGQLQMKMACSSVLRK